MATSIDGFYAAYLTGAARQGFAMLVFANGKMIGADAGGGKYDGDYRSVDSGYDVNLRVSLPANAPLLQGGSTGPEGDTAELQLRLPGDFLQEQFVRVNGKHGPVNAKLVKLRDIG